MDILAKQILAKVDDGSYDLGAYADFFAIVQQEQNQKVKRKYGEIIKDRLLKAISKCSLEKIDKFSGLYWEVLLYEGRYLFDSYMLYVEKNRPNKEKYYLPRREKLKPIVDELQALWDGQLDELGLSMPPRTGKTTLLVFFISWIIGVDSEKSNLYCSYSDIITRTFYNGVLEIITDKSTYTWAEVFPNNKIVGQNANDETINIDRNKRYPSITCRSLYGTLNGACDCNGILIADDLLSGIDEAINKDRLRTVWGKVDNNMLPRAKESSKILWCGTRWSLQDPMGKRIELLSTNENFKSRNWKIVNTPALDENDESNFEYRYGVGFSSDYYKQRRASFEDNNDIASWNAQYCGEPIEREGILFEANSLRYYNGVLPSEIPDRIFLAIDPAFGGGDFVAGPICFMYGNDIYVQDVVYDNGDKKMTQPIIANACLKYKVAALQIEANKSTESYAEEVDRMLKNMGYKLNLTTKPASSRIGKVQRIFDKAPDIRESMIFRNDRDISQEYKNFMRSVTSFTINGKNQNDDAPDSLAMAIDMVRNPMGEYEIFRRTF